MQQGTKTDTDSSTQPTRRRFYVGAIYTLWGIISGSLAVSAITYLFVPPAKRRIDQWVNAGDVSKLMPDTPVEMFFRRTRVDGWRVLSEQSSAWVVKSAQGNVTAFSPACTHLGCAYHWDGSAHEFICPCHSSIFSITGEVQSGPAPRPLDRYEAKVEDGKLMLGQLRVSEAKEA